MEAPFDNQGDVAPTVARAESATVSAGGVVAENAGIESDGSGVGVDAATVAFGRVAGDDLHALVKFNVRPSSKMPPPLKLLVPPVSVQPRIVKIGAVIRSGEIEHVAGLVRVDREVIQPRPDDCQRVGRISGGFG